MAALLLTCRAGFEKECAAEIQTRMGAVGVAGWVRAQSDAAYLLYTFQEPPPPRWRDPLPCATPLTFARQRIATFGAFHDLPEQDRLTPLLELAHALGGPFQEPWLESPDTNAGKEVQGFCRRFATPLRLGLERAGLLTRHPQAPRLHLFLLDSRNGYLGVGPPPPEDPWAMGQPRLRLLREAPSRSVLKLEEALLRFLPPEQRESRLQAGMGAVDLGAAPGGWSWLLARRGLHVTAVDNGPLAPAALEAGRVEHVRADGFRYRPRQPVEWLVCDMVEQPIRIAALMAQWLREGWCREAIFNLKLPMKRRFEEVERCRALLLEQAPGCGVTLRHLTHDREEVTGHLFRLDRRGGS